MKKKTTVQTRLKWDQTTVNSSVAKINNRKLASIEDAQIVSIKANQSSLTRNRSGTKPEASGIIAFIFSMLIVGVFKFAFAVIAACFKLLFKVIAAMFGFGWKMTTDSSFRNPTQKGAAIRAKTGRNTAISYNIKDARNSNIHIHNY